VDFDLRQLRLDPAKLLIGQVDVGSAKVLLDTLDLARAGDGHTWLVMAGRREAGL